ncbi:hypothetical protein ACF09J_32395 [Streptomyces sp. NPDC014889]|uniref:hypothetical protein n=1 Tax=Streptomyces sp. NPDC014889 TaxID=3364928 RepID=UPI0036FDE40B
MLLEMDSCGPQGAYVSRPTSDNGDPFAGPALHDERTGTDRPVPGPRLLPEGCTKWLVGRTGAVWTVLVRANSRREWEARGRVPVEAGQVEVHRIRCDAIGRYSLVRCL